MSRGSHRLESRRPGRALRHLVLLVVAVCVTSTTAAWGYWTAPITVGGSGAAVATSVDAGATPTTSASGQSVAVSWTASTLANGRPVTGYVVKRYDADTLTPQPVGSGCESVTTTSCTETGVPAGTWRYSVTPTIGTNWRGGESGKSPAVTVVVADTTAPTNNLSVSVTSGDASLTGTTVYYRGVGSGELRLSNAVADAGSGPASSTTAALSGTSTGWSHTGSTVSTPMGGPFVSNPFTWSASTTTSPQVTVTGRDAAANTAATTMTFTNDSTGPSGSTISYADGATTGASVSVSLTTGTDAGAGVGTRRLQRASATLSSAGSCGTYSTFANLEPTAPTSPYTDSNISAGTCYRYQYVVKDKLGNQETATSASVVKVDYGSAVSATSGLVSHWRLGEASASMTAYDSFTGTNGVTLSGRAADLGGSWALRSGINSAIMDNRVHRNGSGHALFQSPAVPSSADYSVEADLHVKTNNLTGEMIGVVGRLDPSVATYYVARWEQADTSWNIAKVTNGTVSYPSASWYVANEGALTAGQNYRIRLEMVGASLKLYVNGIVKVNVTDASPITTAGRAGLLDGNTGSTVTKSSTTGMHLDNFQVLPATYPRATDSKGANTGDYKHGPTLAVSGALAGDTNTAAQFDGVNDYVQTTPTTGLPIGAASRSVEAWFKTTSAAQQVIFAYGSITETQEFGLWLNAGGSAMTAWGFGETLGHNKVFTLPSAVNDGAWHHVVKTYDGTSLTLYIDGVALPSQTASRSTVIDAYGFSIGAVINPATSAYGSFFNGAIDEVALYNTVLTASTVTDHHKLGKAVADTAGPTGGSVDATGLVGTGSRYSTSTALSVALAKGTDPSGLGASGAELRRATATLTSGSCGTYGASTLVTGGTDPASPYADTVTDQACYRYQYVVPDVHGNTTTYTSGDIKVDTTAPSAPSLGFTTSTADNSYWSGTGSTVWYRPTVAGSFVASASGSTDAGSGVATYLFPQLGTGWTGTVGTGVTYAWTANPTAPGTKNVTARNNAALVSTGTGFTPTADDTAPTAGTVTYADGGTSTTSVTVSFTTGTDAGSGVATRLLQRASATLTDATCGTFGSFATVTGGTNPAGAVTDTVARGTCYKYQYVVRDNVGNEHTATSGNVVKVWPTYLSSVSGTAGLVNHYRLGETTSSADTFTGSATGVLLHNRSTEASWTKHPISTSDATVTAGGRVRKSGTSTRALYYTGATPSSADYTVEADVHVASNLTSDIAGVVGRLDPLNTNGTFYVARYEQENQRWNLHKVVNGVYTYLGQSATTQPLAVGTTYRVALDLNGTTIRVLVNGTQHVSVVDAGITAAGRGGVAMGFHASASTTVTDTTGLHLDGFAVNPPLADAKGTNHGDYFGGVTLGVVGAVSGDASTAAQFDGANDFATFTRQVSDDLSVELWFKSTQGIGTGTQWHQGAGLVDGEVNGTANDFGVSLRSDGRVVAGVGNPDTSIVSSTGGLNDGAWHHVVFTRARLSGAMVLYVDGAQVGTATGNTLSLTGPTNLSIGRLQTGLNHFAGTIDEVAVYNSVLSASAVTAHHGAAR